MTKRYDYGAFKLHPLWGIRPEHATTEKITVGGEPLFRGTTSAFLDRKGLHNHPPEGGGYGQPDRTKDAEERIYMSEGSEDAEGYGLMISESHGGKPLLCSIRVSKDLFKKLRPGYEGLGEWYVEQEFIPRALVRCREVEQEEE